MAIELEITEPCTNCPGLEPELTRFFAGNIPIYLARCKNEKLCTAIEKRLREELVSPGE